MAACALVGLGVSLASIASCGHNNEMGWLHAEHVGDLSHGPAPRAAFDHELDEACGPGALSARGEAAFLRKPYLQRVTPDGAWLLWTTPATTPATVTAWDSANGSANSSANGQKLRFNAEVDVSAPIEGGRQMVARLTALQPGRIYCYEVHDASGVLAEAAGFRTAPASASTVRFVALGDLGQKGVDQLAVVEQMQRVPFEIVLMAGDLAYEDGRLEEYESYFFGVYAEVARKVPLMVASGNHDYNTDDAAAFRQVFALFENGGERWYSFDWGPMHVAVLDTELMGATQTDWLERDLSAATAPWKIAMMHRPAYSSGAHGSDEHVQEQFVPIFERHGVQLVLAGHDHHYERTHSLNGVIYIVTGAGGVGTRAVDRSDFTAFSERVSHFVHVTVEDQALTMRAIDASGMDFDSLKLTR